MRKAQQTADALASSQKVPVTILIPVKNEELNIARCLKSVQWASEIIVVDSHSSDRTAAIATELGATIVQFEFKNSWPKKKNWALENLPFANEWVFILDADEVLPPAAEQEFRAVIADPKQNSGFMINRRFYFMHKWLKHAYFPNWNLRLFRHKLGRYEQLTDQPTDSGDNEVHEHIILPGSVAKLECIMDHYAFPTVSVFMEKHNRYSSWEAVVALDQSLQRGSKLNTPELRVRRKLRQIYQLIPAARPLLRFAYIYIWEKGFLDGAEGFYFACFHAVYELMTLAKIRELTTEKLNLSASHEFNNDKTYN